MKVSACTVALFVLAAVCPTAHGSPRQDGSTRQDAALLREVVRQVNGYTRLTVFDDVGVQVEAGIVTLSGKVTAPYKKDQLASRVRELPGLVALRNDIGVLPVSQDDDELRYRIAGAIYGNPSFWEYAALANPPIHIIVEHGRVTLVGIVRTDVERVLARSLASVFGVRSITNNLKTEAELRATEPPGKL
jgi:hyperosmotically inducible protein